MNFFKKLEENFEEMTMVSLACGIGIVMLFQVIARYIFKSPLVWAEEACRYMFVWITFMSMGYCLRKGTLIKVDALLMKFPKLIQNIIEIISSVLTLALFAILFMRSITVVQQIAASGQKSPALGIPMMYIYGASIVGFGLGVVRYIQSLVRKYILKSLEEKDRLETTTN